jgi:tRNA A-37 threonylcarbamoyl transferase component Bud32
LIGFALAIAGAAFAVFIDRRVESVLKTQLSAVLTVTLDTAVAGMVTPLQDAVRAARACAADSRILQLLACSEACDAELGATALPFLREGGFAGVDVADSGGRLRPGWLASAGLTQLPAAFSEALAQTGDEPALTSARVFGTPWTFVLVRVPQSASAALVFRLPLARWTAPLRAARPGETGETYAFDRNGRLISESRYAAQLARAGVLDLDSRTPTFGLPLRDPGGDVTQGYRPVGPQASWPRTRVVEAALRGESGVTVEPYRDYRGVLVVGAYRYLPELGVGVASEIDRGTAYAAVSTLKLMLEWLICAFLLTALVLLGAAVLALRMRRRMQTAEKLVARFGQYRLVRKIGEGGMGAVYLASHEMLRRPAAIKLLRPERASREAIARFEREVRVTATLKHPNTVAVYDYGRTERGDLFYVMEYLDGLDLERLVERFGPMCESRVIHYLRQLCGSLAEAHAAKLVHRDIKPANLLACRVGGVPETLKVVDFGVAKPLTGEKLGLTVDRVLLGTPEYMAPELFESSERATPQSDLYSAGAVAYFLLTGHPVFEVSSLTELCLAQLTRTPDPPSVRLGADVDPQLEAAILACLAKRAEARPASARALLTMLERSKQANAWKVSDAEAWWNRHADELHEVRVSREPASPSPEFTRIQPVARV